MRIGIVTLRFDAPGGVEQNVREVAKGLRAAGEDVRVYASDLYREDVWERRTDFAPEVDGVPVARFPVYRRLIPGLTLPLWTGLIPALARSGVDIVHSHSHRYGHVLEAAAVCRRRGIPHVVSVHYHPADRREPWQKRLLLRGQDLLFGIAAYRDARAIVVETRQEAERIGAFVDPERVHCIPPGVDLEEWSHPEADRPPPGLPEGFLLYAGRIASNKGLEGLLRAVAHLSPSQRPPLVLVGPDWGEAPRLAALARELGIAGSVHFTGRLDRPAYRGTFRAARAFALPSEWEAFGLVLLEAMAAGLPIVATAVGGIPEVLEGGASGILVPYGDPAAMADGIEMLFHDEAKRSNLRRAGTLRVGQLSWAECVRHHRELYRALVT